MTDFFVTIPSEPIMRVSISSGAMGYSGYSGMSGYSGIQGAAIYSSPTIPPTYKEGDLWWDKDDINGIVVDTSTLVPYSGAIKGLDLGVYSLTTPQINSNNSLSLLTFTSYGVNNDINIIAGDQYLDYYSGGNINIHAGNGLTDYAYGGNIAFTAGVSTYSSGGSIVFYAGTSSYGYGGTLNFYGGDSYDGYGGPVGLTGGAGYYTGGGVYITGGYSYMNSVAETVYIQSGGNGAIDMCAGGILISPITYSIRISYEFLDNSSGYTFLSPSYRTLNDYSGAQSVGWGARYLYDTNQNIAVDWQGGLLYSGGNVSLDWLNKQFKDSLGSVVLDWNTVGAIRVSKISQYDAITTVSNGVPSELATVDLTAQVISIGLTTLYSIPAQKAGMYRISFYSKVTRAATSSSGLGGLTIRWTDPDAVAQSFSSANNTGNSTTSYIQNTVIIYCKASTNITYSMGYASSGATAMQYNLHIKVEAL